MNLPSNFKSVADDQIIQKVAAFITRHKGSGNQLLLIDHPYAGIQNPAETVEINESPERAILRETFEEIGLTISSWTHTLGCQE